MFKYRFLYFLFIAFSTAFMIAYKSKISSTIFIFALIFPAAALIFLIFSRVLLKADIRYRSLSIEKNECTGIDITVTNRFIMPLSPAELYVIMPLKTSGTFEYQDILISVPPLSSVTVSFNLPVRYRGEYECGIEKIRIYDLLKMFSFTKKMRRYEKMLVVPRQFVIDPITEVSGSESETAAGNPFAAEKNVFVSVREYIPGDPIKHIHRALSAKSDKLMIKQFELGTGGTALIIPDFNEYLPYEEENAMMVDSVIETLLAVNRSIISQKQTCLNVWFSQQDEKCEQLSISDETGYFQLFDMMSRIPRQKVIYLPEGIADNCSAVPEDTTAVYFITSHAVRNEFISKIRSNEQLRNRKIRILLIKAEFQGTDSESDNITLADADTELWHINANDIVGSLNAAIGIYRRR